MRGRGRRTKRSEGGCKGAGEADTGLGGAGGSLWTAQATARPSITRTQSTPAGCLPPPPTPLPAGGAIPRSKDAHHHPPPHPVCCGWIGVCRQERAEGLEVTTGSGPPSASAAVLQQRGGKQVERRRRGVCLAGQYLSPLLPPPPSFTTLPRPHTVSASSVDPPASMAACSAGTSPALAAAKTAPAGAGAWL